MNLKDEIDGIVELAYSPHYYESILDDEPIGICFNCGADVYEDTLYKKKQDYLFDNEACFLTVFYGADYNEYV